jgi:hypothetical protein
VLFVVGLVIFRAGGQNLTALDRIAIGLGLTLLALHILLDTLARPDHRRTWRLQFVMSAFAPESGHPSAPSRMSAVGQELPRLQ